MELDWFDDGNLLILLPEPLLSEWHGIDSDDYARACTASNSWLNIIPVQKGHGLLFGGDTGMVLFTPGPENSTFLIRWVYAEDEHELVEIALRRDSVTKSEPDLVFNNVFAKWWLLNAATNPPSDQQAMRSITLPLGQLHVETVYCESKTNAAIVHKFRESA